MNKKDYKKYLNVKKEILAIAEKKSSGHSNFSDLEIIAFVGIKNEEENNPSIGEIKEIMDMSSAATSSYIKKLRKSNPPLLEKRYSEKDERKAYVELTEAGKEIYRKIILP